jgi:hypothetical protein
MLGYYPLSIKQIDDVRVASCISTCSATTDVKPQNPVFFRVTGFKVLFSWHPLVQKMFVGSLTRCRQRTYWKTILDCERNIKSSLGMTSYSAFITAATKQLNPVIPDLIRYPVIGGFPLPAFARTSFAGMTSEVFFVACSIMSVGWKQERG